MVSFLQEVAELKEEDILNSSDRASTVDSCNTLSESLCVCKLLSIIIKHAGIDDMFDVKTALKNLNNWQCLGLALGVLYPTLERIEVEQCRDIEKSKTKMIAVWLKQQDGVVKKGVPSWEVLQNALKLIDENDLADSIKRRI